MSNATTALYCQLAFKPTYSYMKRKSLAPSALLKKMNKTKTASGGIESTGIAEMSYHAE